MSLKRVAKSLAALSGGQGVTILYNLMLPPIFLHHYTVANYGEWLTLSATVGYLGTLNFGLQTFANNQVAIFYNRGELEEAHTVQATALAILLGIVGFAAFVSASVFLLPVNHWLGLKNTQQVVSWTIYLLGLQVLLRMVFGFFVGIFLVIGIAYRGQHWNIALALTQALATAVQAMYGVSFPWIAAQQLLCVVLCSLLALVDLRIKAAPIFPRLRYTDPKRFGDVLKPSGHFGLLFCGNFLVYQLPIMIIQRILGPTTVVVFSLTRSIYSMARQTLTMMSWAIGPEVNEFYGQGNWVRLFRLYELSERLIFAFIPLVTIGTMLATPALLAVWLHKPALYNPSICLIMALISGVMGIKEHKNVFQTSSNEHAILAYQTFWSYMAMALISVPAIYRFGMLGFLTTWLITELFQTIALLRLNIHLFSGRASLDFSPVYKLFALMATALVPASWLAYAALHRTLTQVSFTAAAACIILAAISYPLFGLNQVRREMQTRFGLS